MNFLIYLVYLILAYLIGCISPGYFFGKLKGVDLRKVGNKNTGATNTYKNIGKLQGIITALIDIFKGTFIVVIAIYFSMPVVIVYLVAILSIIGHNYPFYLSFRGGRGIATSFGGFVPIVIYYHDVYAFVAIAIIIIRTFVISKNLRKWLKKKLSLSV